MTQYHIPTIEQAKTPVERSLSETFGEIIAAQAVDPNLAREIIAELAHTLTTVEVTPEGAMPDDEVDGPTVTTFTAYAALNNEMTAHMAGVAQGFGLTYKHDFS